MFENFTSAERRRENMIEGWGSTLPGNDDQKLHMMLSDYSQPSVLLPGKKRGMLTQLLCPFFNNGKMIPLSLCGGLVLELELGAMDDAFVSGSVHNWEIQAPEILVDVCGIRFLRATRLICFPGRRSQLLTGISLLCRRRFQALRPCPFPSPEASLG